MKTLPRIGTAIATIMAFGFAFVVIARLQRTDVSAADPPPITGKIDHTQRPATAPLSGGPNVTPAAEPPIGRAVAISAELHEIHDEVRALRRDVRRLIDILEDRDGTSLKAVPLDDDDCSNTSAHAYEAVWQLIGIHVEPAEVESETYRGGLKIVEVRRESPAAKEGIQPGDILVGLDKWETINCKNLHFVVGQIEDRKPESIKFYVLRAQSTSFGRMKLATLTDKPIVRELRDMTLDEAISIGLRNSKAIRELGGVTPFQFDGKQEVLLSRVNKEVGLADFEAAVRNHVCETEATYWELWAAQRSLDAAKKSRDAAQALWNEVHEQKAGGKADPRDETQARGQYFFFRDQLRSAQQELYRREIKLRSLIGLPPSDGRLIRAADEPTTDEYIIDWDNAKRNALENSVELRRQRRAVSQAELQLDCAKASLQPQLDVARLYRWNTDEAGEIELNFQIPVGSRRVAASVRNATLVVAREKARLKDMETISVHRLTTATRDVGLLYQSTKTHFNRWVATESEAESTTELYTSGKTTLEIVLDAQRRRAQSEVAYALALAHYMAAINDVHYHEGSLLAEHNLGIEIAEEPASACRGAEEASAPSS